LRGLQTHGTEGLFPRGHEEAKRGRKIKEKLKVIEMSPGRAAFPGRGGGESERATEVRKAPGRNKGPIRLTGSFRREDKFEGYVGGGTTGKKNPDRRAGIQMKTNSK